MRRLPLVMALVSVVGCGARSEPRGLASGHADSGATGGTAGAFGGAGGASGSGSGPGGSGGIDMTGGSGGGSAAGGSAAGGTGGAASGGSGGVTNELCPEGSLESFTVDVPPEGVQPLRGRICMTPEPVVQSNRAAAVTLQKLGPRLDLQLAAGFVQIDPNIIDGVLGVPLIEVLDATVPALTSMQVSDVTPQPGGFSFQARFGEPIQVGTDGSARMTVRVIFEFSCGEQFGERFIHAVTNVHVCVGASDYVWVSSGFQCVVCR